MTQTHDDYTVARLAERLDALVARLGTLPQLEELVYKHEVEICWLKRLAWLLFVTVLSNLATVYTLLVRGR